VFWVPELALAHRGLPVLTGDVDRADHIPARYAGVPQATDQHDLELTLGGFELAVGRPVHQRCGVRREGVPVVLDPQVHDMGGAARIRSPTLSPVIGRLHAAALNGRSSPLNAAR
jgi:hypothetical protein